MAITNYERVGRAMELLKTGLAPFVERELKNIYKSKADSQAAMFMGDDRLLANKPVTQWDVAPLLKLMWESWNDVFRNTLGFAERSLISELRDIRNKWAHQIAFSSDDAYRALDTTSRILSAISSPQTTEIEKMKMELLRIRFDEQARSEKRKTADQSIESSTTSYLKPWREVVTPHIDVASGRYSQAEFAADLWQVHLGEGTEEYRDPIEFFRRTYLTESLKRLLTGAILRLSDQGGSPVIQLQTNFGGGKTHSMLALYHLFSGKAPSELFNVGELLQSVGINHFPTVKRVVLVGNKISPGNPVCKPDGTIVRTLWGELAWQLGGKNAFDHLKADDEHATNPGDKLRELLNEYGPCLILIDEWVAYARQLHDSNDLPAGDFCTQFTFAQTLTESAKLAKSCMLVISLPASDATNAFNAQCDDVEVGGQRGREALDRLRNVIGRVESPWRPATAEEGFEIVRRRLFEPLAGQMFRDRDVTARSFADFYRNHKQEFPPECCDTDYEKRIKAAYPIHPEVFERLYADWSASPKFQRTRGVLRLMAAVIHWLWEKGDKNPLIMPANIPIDDQDIQFELTRYLSDNWIPILEKDVDGPNSLPLQLDRELSGSLGKYAACRRVARTLFLGSAPMPDASNRGIEDKRIKLGSVMPGEPPAIFGDALRRLSQSATYLYSDGPRYWYSTQPTVTKLADDYAELNKRDRDKLTQEIQKRLRKDLETPGDFKRTHSFPSSSADVSDNLEAGLVVLGIDHPFTNTKDVGNIAEIEAKNIFENRGSSSRLYRNTLIFLAADKTRLQDLEESICRFLAWESIISEENTLNLSTHQKKQAKAQLENADSIVNARLPDTYSWMLVPYQSNPQSSIEWQSIRLNGQEKLAVRASKKLKNDDLLLTNYAASNLRLELDKVPLWRGSHVSIRQIIEDFARYIYLPRLKSPDVLIKAIQNGFGSLVWEQDSFAYADSFDESSGHYRGLRLGHKILEINPSETGLLVQPQTANKQILSASLTSPSPAGDKAKQASSSPPPESKFPIKLTRYFGNAVLDPMRTGRDAGKIADEVIAHLLGLGSSVRVTMEIEATLPDGAPEHIVRAVTENSRTLKFISHGFEKE